MISEDEVKDAKKDMISLIENVIGRPGWFRELEEEEKEIAIPILDEFARAIIKYFFKLRPSSKEKAQEYMEKFYKRINSKISKIENEKIRNLLGDYVKKMIDILLQEPS